MDDTALTPELPELPEPSAPAETPPPRRGRWRSVLAGGVAGGVLAASVAVPGTLWLDRRDDAQAAATGSTATQPEQLPQDQLPQDQQPQDQLPDGGYGSATVPETQASGTDATDEQSVGVVLINTVTTTGAGAGTGLVISADGLVLTNYHVVEDSTSVKVTIATTGKTYDATVLGHDETADIAVLQLTGAEDLATVVLDSDGTSTDDPVTAVGNAEGQGYLSAVTGTIVGEEKSITASEGSGPLADSEDLTGLLETDAAVVPGYSGGPLLDAEGEVVGINTAASTSGYSGLSSSAADSYAVPIDDAMAVAEQIEAGDETGSVAIGPAAYLGIGVSDTTGAQVARVEAGGPAADAGIVAGDTITAVDGRAVTSYDVLVRRLAAHEPGDRVSLSWTDSQGTSHTATATLGSSPVN